MEKLKKKKEIGKKNTKIVKRITFRNRQKCKKKKQNLAKLKRIIILKMAKKKSKIGKI